MELHVDKPKHKELYKLECNLVSVSYIWIWEGMLLKTSLMACYFQVPKNRIKFSTNHLPKTACHENKQDQRKNCPTNFFKPEENHGITALINLDV